MIEVQIPEAMDLTHSDNGVAVYIVTDQHGMASGVYYSLERACQYITEWILAIDQIDDEDGIKGKYLNSNPIVDEGHGVWNWQGYMIQRTYLRF